MGYKVNICPNLTFSIQTLIIIVQICVRHHIGKKKLRVNKFKKNLPVLFSQNHTPHNGSLHVAARVDKGTRFDDGTKSVHW